MFWYLVGMADSRSLSERLAKLPPGRHLVPRDFVAQNQRERMLLATAELVAERGYQKTTIELIAKTRAGRPLDLLRAVLQQGGVLPRRLRRDDRRRRGGLRRAARSRAALGGADLRRRSRSSSRWWSTSRRGRKLCIVEAQAAGGEALAPLPGDAGADGAEAARGAGAQPAREQAARRARGGDRRRPAWLVHQRLVADRDDEIKGLLPEMLQVTLTPT